MKRKDNIFTDVFMKRPESSKFDLSHEKKLTFSMGEMIPICIMETLPGDKFELNYVNLIRFMPLIAPVMHKVKVKTEYFFVPNRILWNDWEQFITGVNPGGGPDVLWPYIFLDDVVPKGSIADYLGIPPGDYSTQNHEVSALPLAAYLKIYDDWYRDQNLIAPTFEDSLLPGSNDTNYKAVLLGDPLKRAWEHDYFTSALPTSQQGTDVEIPLVNLADVPVDFTAGAGGPGVFRDPVTGAILDTGFPVTNETGPVPFPQSAFINGDPAAYDPRGSLSVDIQAEAATINDLREAFSLQAFLERSIRGGMRYIEQIRSHFGVTSSDARLQRPELIGRNVQNVTISEVLATAQNTGDGVAVGQMAGHGISVGGKDTLHYNCEEHGFIFGIISVIPDTSYQDGLNKMFSRLDRLDYAWPDFAHLGEQPILNKELIAAGTTPPFDPDGVFGYIPRYAEYRYIPSTVAGEFRDTLSFWTLGRIFDPMAPPELNEEFVTADPSTRIFAVTTESEDHILAQVINGHEVIRKLPRYGIPSTLG